jgi:hypothetical protein
LICSSAVITTTLPFSSNPDGAIIQWGNRTYPRVGEGTMVRWNGCLLLFLSRQSESADVGASNITMHQSVDGTGASWSVGVVVPPSSHAPSRANPGAVVLLDKSIVLTYFVGFNHTAASRIVRKSTDGGTTWSHEQPLTDGSYVLLWSCRLMFRGYDQLAVHVRVPMGTQGDSLEESDQA